LDRAIADFDAQLEIAPRNANAYSGRALAYLTLRNPPRALVDADRAFELQPNEAFVLQLRGRILMALGRREEALRDLREVLNGKGP